MLDKIIDLSNATDIIPLTVGYEKCASGHKYGPHVRNCYLIHFCLSGKGVLTDKFGTHNVGRGELFIIRPEEVSTYMADLSDPWEYLWISFNGKCAEVFCSERSVYPYKKHIADRLKDLYDREERSPSIYIATVYELIYHLFSKNNAPKPETDPIYGVERYIDFNYMKDITVNGLSQAFGFERSYLYRLFKQKNGKSIKEYLIQVRMLRACELLERGYSVKNTAFSVGYKDEFTFSRAFKKYFSYPPTAILKKT